MSHLPAIPRREESPFYQGLANIHDRMNATLNSMTKNSKKWADRSQLEGFAREILQLADKYHPMISQEEREPIMSAICELTEVPVLQPQMENMAVKVALQEATKHIGEYLKKF